MICIKTGAHCYSQETGEYLYGDLFGTSGDKFVMRICARSREPINGMGYIHLMITHFEHWFDEHKTSQSQNSTMFIDGGERFSYEGEQI